MKYRYHWLFKLTALVLAAVSGAALLLGACGLVMDDLGYYEQCRRGQISEEIWRFSSEAARAVFDNFAWRDTGIEPKLFERFFRWGADVDAVESLEQDFHYTIKPQDGSGILDGTFAGEGDWEWSTFYHFDVRRGFVTEMPKAELYPSYGQMKNLVYMDLEGNPLPMLGEGVTDVEYYVVSDDGSVNPQNISMDLYRHADANGADYTIYRMEYTGYDSYEVEICLTAQQLAAIGDMDVEEEFLPQFLRTNRDAVVSLAVWGGVGLLVAVLWLALVAGKSPHREGVMPGGLNRIPLDLWLTAVAVGLCGAVVFLPEILESMVWNSGWSDLQGDLMDEFCLMIALLGLMGAAAGEGIAMFLMAFAAQTKMGEGYWLKHTSLGIAIRYGWKYGTMALRWIVARVKGLVCGLLGFCKGFVRMLPLTWQWLLASGILWFVMLVCLLLAYESWSVLPMFLGILVTVPVVLYGAYCFGALREGAKKMSGGDLEEKIDNRLLRGCFGDFAGHLNTLGDVCIESARQQMKSERMKSELITNVSHDIKTPLTSIINYVDLLQKTEDEEQRREHLEVLDRQSQKLKKLIEDLMDMSKATSGNMAVEITPTDVGEAVNQALGEFADNLDRCGLAVMRKVPSEPIMALCDGRHLWRVLSNVLSNVVKYAMPGTRVYVDVQRCGAKVELSVKNISAQMLNISAGELMERFVRGDSSRNTEGNGLGLNIAKSLMELQGGRLDLVVDGDLFKVILTLNGA